MTGVPPVVALFGATALGKSDVALELASRLGADIVVADSMQIYAGLPILTNQPGAASRARVRYHLVGWAPPQEDFTVAEYAEQGARGRGRRARRGPERGGRRRLRPLPARPPRRPRLRRVARPGAQGRSRGAVGARAGGARGRAPPARAGRRRARGLRQRAPCHPRARVARRARRAADGRSSGSPAAATSTRCSRSCPTRTAPRSKSASDGGSTRCWRPARSRRSPRPGPPGRSHGRRPRRSACVSSAPSWTASSRCPDAAARMKARTRTLARRQLTWMRKLPDVSLVPVAGRAPCRGGRRHPDPPARTRMVGCRFGRGESRALYAHRGS